jgi:hypothetical protein
MEHPFENTVVDWIKSVPINKPAEPCRIENCGLPNHRAIAGWFNFELKPRTARNFHFRHEVEPAARFDTLDAPEIESIASDQCVSITAAPAQSHATHKEIEEASNLPEKTCKVPTVLASNPLDGRKGQGRGN